MIKTLALLAGGMATRLRPVTEKIPKSMLEVGGKPFIHHQLKLMKEKGIEEVVICANYLGHMINEYAGDGGSFGLKIEYSYDGKKMLGTGGAIKKALGKLGDKFFVMYGDSYLDADYNMIGEHFLKLRKEYDYQGLMTVYKNEGKFDSSNIEFSDGTIVEYDKKNKTESMSYIDYGLGILTPQAFDDHKDAEEIDLAEVYKHLLRKGKLAGYEVKERFYEIGSFEGLDETHKLLLNKK